MKVELLTKEDLDNFKAELLTDLGENACNCVSEAGTALVKRGGS